MQEHNLWKIDTVSSYATLHLPISPAYTDISQWESYQQDPNWPDNWMFLHLVVMQKRLLDFALRYAR